MSLLEYLKSLTKEQRAAFAKRCDTSVEYLYQIAYGNRSPKVELAVEIERESEKVVTCERLLPDVDWAYLRARAAPVPSRSRAAGTR